MILLTLAGILVLLMGVAHSYLGERYILTRLFRRADLPRLFGSDWFTRRTLRFAWHITTVAWWGLAAILFLLADGGPVSRQAILLAIAATFLASALLTLIPSRGRHLAWVVMTAIAAATAWAAFAP